VTKYALVCLYVNVVFVWPHFTCLYEYRVAFWCRRAWQLCISVFIWVEFIKSFQVWCLETLQSVSSSGVLVLKRDKTELDLDQNSLINHLWNFWIFLMLFSK